MPLVLASSSLILPPFGFRDKAVYFAQRSGRITDIGIETGVIHVGEGRESESL